MYFLKSNRGALGMLSLWRECKTGGHGLQNA
jgi:hypothetical protein